MTDRQRIRELEAKLARIQEYASVFRDTVVQWRESRVITLDLPLEVDYSTGLPYPKFERAELPCKRGGEDDTIRLSDVFLLVGEIFDENHIRRFS